jgi:hypothetical protein
MEAIPTIQICTPRAQTTPTLTTYPVLVDHIVRLPTVQHLPVPVCKPFWLGDLLLIRMAMKNVIITFARRARPDVGSHEPEEREEGKRGRKGERKGGREREREGNS